MNNAHMPATPTTPDYVFRGLTKREHFAALALQGLVGRTTIEEAAALAMAHADALLEELDKPLNLHEVS